MIVPRAPLLVLTGVVIAPAMGVFTMAAGNDMPPIAAAALLTAGVVAAAALLDLALSLNRGFSVQAELPHLVRLTRDKDGQAPVIFTYEKGAPRRLRFALPAPPELGSRREAYSVTLPPWEKRMEAQWPCTPTRRGQYLIDGVYVEAPSRLHLWGIRSRKPTRCEVRVYPNLAYDRRQLAGFFLNRGMFGVHAQRQIGKGREFEHLREYLPGDSYDEIHWKATAKRGHPVTKVYQIERTQEVYVLIDASRLSRRRLSRPLPDEEPVDGGDGAAALGRQLAALQSEGPSQLERFLAASLVLALAAQQQGDRFGLLVFSDRVDRFVPAGSGAQHYNVCRDALYTLEPRQVNPDFSELATFVRTRMRRRALLMMLTNLDDPVLSESLSRNVDLMVPRHVLLVNMLRPPQVQPIFSDEEVEDVDGVYRALAGHLQWRDLRELERTLRRKSVRFSLLEHEQMAPDLISQYVNVKRRQVL